MKMNDATSCKHFMIGNGVSYVLELCCGDNKITILIEAEAKDKLHLFPFMLRIKSLKYVFLVK